MFLALGFLSFISTAFVGTPPFLLSSAVAMPQTPIVLNNEPFDFDTLFKDPRRFVVEGNLYHKGISYQIKNIDGAYHIAAIDLKGLDGLSKEELAEKDCKISENEFCKFKKSPH